MKGSITNGGQSSPFTVDFGIKQGSDSLLVIVRLVKPRLTGNGGGTEESGFMCGSGEEVAGALGSMAGENEVGS